MSNSLTKEVYSGTAATEFFYYYLLTADYVLGTLYVLTYLVSTRGLGNMLSCHPIVEMSRQAQRHSEDYLCSLGY